MLLENSSVKVSPATSPEAREATTGSSAVALGRSTHRTEFSTPIMAGARSHAELEYEARFIFREHGLDPEDLRVACRSYAGTMYSIFENSARQAKDSAALAAERAIVVGDILNSIAQTHSAYPPIAVL